MTSAEELIGRAYAVFADFAKPRQCTNHLDLEDAEFDTMLLSVERRELSMDHVGTIAWGALPFMNSEALVYFLPRLIELAVTNATNSDGEAFFIHFICTFDKGANKERLKLLGPDQKEVVADTFKFLSERFEKELEADGWLDEAKQAVAEWGDC